MTALKQYQRLEASGLWRPTPETQRREVIVSIGDATLTISDLMDRPLTHWSLAAVVRKNPGERPAIYAPDGDPGETLELASDEAEMIAAIEKLRRAIERNRPRPGRLRRLSIPATIAACLALLVFWLPGAMMRHTVKVVPDIRRQEIGEAVLGRIERVAGQACSTPEGREALDKLARRTAVRRIVVLRTGVRDSVMLPGRIILLNRTLIETNEDPAVVAGYVLAERAAASIEDPLTRLLRASGPTAPFRLLTTGLLPPEFLDRYAETVLVAPPPTPPDEAILAEFARAGAPSTPYAYARDITGESVLGLIEADPMTGQDPAPVLPDRDWVLLQNICGG